MEISRTDLRAHRRTLVEARKALSAAIDMLDAVLESEGPTRGKILAEAVLTAAEDVIAHPMTREAITSGKSREARQWRRAAIHAAAGLGAEQTEIARELGVDRRSVISALQAGADEQLVAAIRELASRRLDELQQAA
jgi:uncharacterized protein (DUF362 family)